MLVHSYEPTEKKKVFYGYAIFWFSLGICYNAGKTLILPVALEITSFSTILIYSGTKYGKKQIKSLSSLLLASGISAVFLSAWIFLPDGDVNGLIFLSIGLLLKSGFSGFHIWLPKVNDGGPSHALGSFAGVLEIFPLLLFYKFVIPNQLPPLFYQILFPLAAIGIFFGGITSFFHKNVKVALAYSSIESLNFLWLCLIITGMFQFSNLSDLRLLSDSFRVLFFLGLFHHSFSKTFQLFLFGMVSRIKNSENSNELKGVGRYLNLSPIILGIGTFSYAVLPCTLGFITESTYFYLNARILDMPIGRSVLLLPSLVFIFFGIVLGGFAHIKLFLSIFLSTPEADDKIILLDKPRMSWILISLLSLGVIIIFLPMVFPYLIQITPLVTFVDPGLMQWFYTISNISILTFLVVSITIFFRNTKAEKNSWDCGGGYNGHELSIPAKVFSEPLKHSLGRYFLNQNGDSKIDYSILYLFNFIFALSKKILKQTTTNRDEDVSQYLAVSSIFLIMIFSLLIMSSSGWF
ncbi:proton-conducting transporter membrane subunit [Leptospira sp. 96542]|nr:proton-conducting transporter membrane subunit [Leptospira sp. 96542]